VSKLRVEAQNSVAEQKKCTADLEAEIAELKRQLSEQQKITNEKTT